MKELKDTFGEWEQMSDNLAYRFTQRYFGKNSEYYWISDEVGGTIAVGDHFFSIDDMVQFTRHKYTKDKMFEYYDYAFRKVAKAETFINIKNWKLLN